MRSHALLALLAGSIAVPAFARTAPDLGGFRVEGLAGYDRADIEDEGAGGVPYGLGVGYDLQSGRAVFGIEAEASDATTDECAVVGSSTRQFAKAGYTNVRIRPDYEDGTAGTAADLSDSTNLDGVRVGAGAQIGIGAHSYVRTEYRYSNYQDGFDRHQL